MMTYKRSFLNYIKNQKKADRTLKLNQEEQSNHQKDIMYIKSDAWSRKNAPNAEIIGQGLGSQYEINVF